MFFFFFFALRFICNLLNVTSAAFPSPWDLNSQVTRWLLLAVFCGAVSCMCAGEWENWKVLADENTLCLEQSLSRGVIQYRHPSVVPHLENGVSLSPRCIGVCVCLLRRLRSLRMWCWQAFLWWGCAVILSGYPAVHMTGLPAETNSPLH